MKFYRKSDLKVVYAIITERMDVFDEFSAIVTERLTALGCTFNTIVSL